MTKEDIFILNTEHDGVRRVFKDGSERSVVKLPSMYLGKGIYKPGWRWSKDAGSQTGKESARHIGYILSGKMKIKTTTGQEKIAGPGEAFEVGPNHDAWVISDLPCVALDFELK